MRNGAGCLNTRPRRARLCHLQWIRAIAPSPWAWRGNGIVGMSGTAVVHSKVVLTTALTEMCWCSNGLLAHLCISEMQLLPAELLAGVNPFRVPSAVLCDCSRGVAFVDRDVVWCARPKLAAGSAGGVVHHGPCSQAAPGGGSAASGSQPLPRVQPVSQPVTAHAV
jgi:hypothetical protein